MNKWAYFVLATLVLGVGAFFALREDRKGQDSVSADAPVPREIALANRTVRATGFPTEFCEHQKASARGTAAYVLALKEGASKLEALKAVRACGARVIGPLPPNAFLVETSIFALGKLSQDPHFVAATEWLPEDKVDARLRQLLDAGTPELDVTVVTLASADVDPLVARALAEGGTRVEGCLNSATTVTLHLPRALVEGLVKGADVRWIEPFQRPKPLNDVAVGPVAMNVRPIWESHGLTGSGQLLTTSDSGIDTGNLQTMHADLRNRVAGFKVVSGCYSYDKNGHGTHTAGSIVGDGTLSSGQIRGTAHGARLWAWFCGGTDGYIYTPETYGELFRPDGATGACFHSASWGIEDSGAYNTMSAGIDNYVWQHPDFLPVIANGNAGSGAKTVGSPATAKNVLSVGATQNDRTGHDGGWGNGNPKTIAQYSSRGPCADGRIKPDVCAPGTGVVSTRSYAASYSYGIHSNTNYAYDTGTSMATPLTAGAAALVREWLVDRRGFTNAVPTAALVKAVLTGGAKDVTTPNHNFGWGRVDLGETLYPSNRAVRLVDNIPFSDGSEKSFVVTLTNDAPFEVQLVWIDYPATAGAAVTLVNDLDLVVSNRTTGAVWYGNGTPGGDHTNTLESVRINAAAGTYDILVCGYDVTYPSTQGGAAALYLRGAFEGEKEDERLVITEAVPSASSISMRVGTTNDFSVTVEASDGLTVSYDWQLDGVTQSETTSCFRYGTTVADHGSHILSVTVSAGTKSITRSWSVLVWDEVHVDATTGDDATATGEEARPFATIPAALKSAVSGDILRVGPGVYAGGLVAPSFAIEIASKAGPRSTILDGGGTNRCFDASGCSDAVLSGFTLTNGWIDASSDADYGAGAYEGTLTNCVITCCRAEGGWGYGGGAAYATLVDCTVENCCGDSVGGGLFSCVATRCLIRDNYTYYVNSYGGGAAASELHHCTVYGNTSGETAGGVDCDTTCENSIVWGNVLDNGETSNWESYKSGWKTYRTTFSYSCTTPTGFTDGGGNVTSAPRWVDAPSGDFRLAVLSPCLASANDGLNMGVWQGAAIQGFVITATADGPGEVEPGEKFVVAGEDATFTAATHHPFFGWTTNGVVAAGVTTNVFTWRNIRADGTLVARFGTTNFFVNAETGDDASSGWSRAEAKRTIQSAVDAAREGERVTVAPGTYAEKVAATASRIAIVGEGGPDATVIDAGEEGRCYVGYANEETLLAGFTLVNGASTNNYGGGVLYGTLSNCVIRSCYAKSGGGGVCAATLYDSVIADCVTDAQGGGAFESTLVNCTVRGNQAGYWRNSYSRQYDRDYGGGIDCACLCTNTIIWGNARKNGTPDNWESYVYRSGWSLYEATPELEWCCTTPDGHDGSNCITNDPLFASAEAADPRIYEISPCIGAGEGGANIGAYRGTGVVKALPAIDLKTATGEQISNAVASVGYVDPAVVPGIGTNGAVYAAFQVWSTNGLKSTAVVYSARAFDSFLVRELVAAPMLLADGRSSKIDLTALVPSGDGTCSVTVSLTDGDTLVPLQPAKEAFATKTRLGGDVHDLRPADPSKVTAATAADGRSVTLTITPPSDTTCYFMRFDIP